MPDEGLKKIIEFYGLDEIMPLICLLLFLHAFRTIFSALMNTLPPIFVSKDWLGM